MTAEEIEKINDFTSKVLFLISKQDKVPSGAFFAVVQDKITCSISDYLNAVSTLVNSGWLVKDGKNLLVTEKTKVFFANKK